jgi:hypothetical protein
LKSGAVAPGKDGKMETEEKEARELIERIKKLGLNDATIGEMVDEIEHLRAKTDSGATVPCSDGLGADNPKRENVDLKFLEEMKARLSAGIARNDTVQLEYVQKMIDDWIGELESA